MSPYKFASKVGISSYNLVLSKGCRLHHVFNWDLVSRAATSLISLRPHKTKIERDHEEYSVDYIFDVRLVIGQGGEVLTYNSELTVCLLIFPSVCCLTKLTIVNNYLFF